MQYADFNPALSDLALEMIQQDKRATAWPLFIVVEDKKIYGVDPYFTDCERERKPDAGEDEDASLCADCREYLDENGSVPEECDSASCEDTFIHYRIEKDVPNMRAGFFFTAKACDEHIAQQRHHYDDSASSYCISAFANAELRAVMTAIVGHSNVKLIT